MQDARGRVPTYEIFFCNRQFFTRRPNGNLRSPGKRWAPKRDKVGVIIKPRMGPYRSCIESVVRGAGRTHARTHMHARTHARAPARPRARARGRPRPVRADGKSGRVDAGESAIVHGRAAIRCLVPAASLVSAIVRNCTLQLFCLSVCLAARALRPDARRNSPGSHARDEP